MPELSIRGYAKHRGVSHTAVEKALAQGRIRTGASGLIDVAEADRDWSQNTSPRPSPRSSMQANTSADLCPVTRHPRSLPRPSGEARVREEIGQIGGC